MKRKIDEMKIKLILKNKQQKPKLDRFRFASIMPNSEEWNKLHTNGLKTEKRIYTASQIPNILGCGYKSRFHYWQVLKGFKKEEFISNPAVLHGVTYEPLAKDQFARKFQDFLILDCGMIIHEQYEFIGATPDAIILTKDNEFFTFEAKCPFSAKHKDEIKDDEQKLKEFYLQPKYVVQVMLQMAVMKATTGYLHFFFADEEEDHRGITFEIPFFNDLFEFIVERVQEFDKQLNDDSFIMENRQKKKITKKILASGEPLSEDQVNEKIFRDMLDLWIDKVIKIIC